MKSQYTHKKIETFKDLKVWQEGHKLVLETYQITKGFPREEKYGLSDQMRRCVVSITSNIAEGFSRRSRKEKIQFYYISKGSLTELHNQLIISKDIGYLSEKGFLDIERQVTIVGKLLTGFIRSSKKL